jgi:O-antigen ligase
VRFSTRIAFILLATAVVLAPLPFGLTDLPAIAVFAIVLGLAFLFALPAIRTRGQIRVLLIGTPVLVLWGAIVIQQMTTEMVLPGAQPNPVWAQAARLLGKPLPEVITVAAYQPFFALGAPLVALLAFLTSFLTCGPGTGRRLLRLVAYSALVYAVYGIAAFIIEPRYVLWAEKEAYQTVLTATFVNRNTAAIYFGSAAVIWLLLICERLRAKQPAQTVDWRILAFDAVLHPSRRTMLHQAALMTVIAAMFMTGSRAGTVISLGGMVLAFVLFFRRHLRRQRLLLVAFIASFIALAMVELLAPGVGSRFELRGLSDVGRLETYRSAIRIIGDYPWYGTGLGTFAWILPAYRSGDISVWGTWDRAHNTLLEVTSDLGLFAAALLLICGAAIFVSIWRSRRFRAGRLVPVAGMTVALIAVAHSLIDFSLQIPGYAAVVATVLGASLASSGADRRG